MLKTYIIYICNAYIYKLYINNVYIYILYAILTLNAPHMDPNHQPIPPLFSETLRASKPSKSSPHAAVARLLSVPGLGGWRKSGSHLW